MPVDLTSLSQKELQALISQANKRKTLISRRKPTNQVKAAVSKLLKSSGWTFEELYGKSGGGSTAGKPATRAARTVTARKGKGKVAVKYRNPSKPEETWTGRGKRPRWLAAELEAGKNVADYLVG